MITFNLQARNGNYYRGHEPSNSSGNCWTGKRSNALTFTIEQARQLSANHYLNIVIAIEPCPISDALFKKEVFCLSGGRWYDYSDE